METKYISVTDTAKMVRKTLKRNFKGVKFSVRSSSYAGGASIDIRWTDGPLAEAVDKVVSLYQGATFDGMTDMKSSHDSVVSNEDGTVERVSFGADYIFTSRDMSEATQADLVAWFTQELGEKFNDEKLYDVSIFEGRVVRGSNRGGEYGGMLLRQKFNTVVK